jgi:hypothetical protein
VVDPWAVDRATFVAVERDRVVAATHVVRYGDDDRVSESYRDCAEVRWLTFWPTAGEAGDAVLRSAIDWAGGARELYADGSLPAPELYGPPDCWPHVLGAYERAGFVAGPREEVVLLAAVAHLPRADGAPAQRSLGVHATRFAQGAAFVEVRTDLTNGGALSRLAGWGDVWELEASDVTAARAVVGHAADWLRLAGVERLLHTTTGDEDLALARELAVRELIRTRRGWRRVAR